MSRTDWVKGRRLIALVVLLAAGAAAGAARSRKAWAFNPQPEPPGRWGMFGIVEGQTARVSVVNTSGDPHVSPPGRAAWPSRSWTPTARSSRRRA